MTPKRIQLRRTKGWRKPDGAITVARPTKWGNPFPVTGETPFGREDAVRMYRELLVDGEAWFAGHRFTGDRPPIHLLSDLRGRDLACWCPLDSPCHADVLLEMANR